METNNRINQIILNYLEGTISPEEWTELDVWLKEGDDHINYFEEILSIWISAETQMRVTGTVIDQEWEKLEKRHFPARTVFSRWKPAIRIAAVFTLGALFSWGISNYRNNSYWSQMKESVITAPLGAKSTVSLPDGTKVILNAGSVLKYPGTFGQNIREVTLEGEAFFEVAKNRSKLFQVRTSDITVKAYGTKFNIKSYNDEKTIETTLVEGSVSVVRNRQQKSKADELFLKPQEQLVFYKANAQAIKTSTTKEQKETQAQETQQTTLPEQRSEKIMITKGIDPALFTSWTEDRLIMKSEPMQKMAVKIERKYNVKIHFEDADMKEFRFTGIVENETLENILAAISIASPIEYTIKDRDIWLRKKASSDKNHTK